MSETFRHYPRAFVDQPHSTCGFFIESLPMREEIRALLGPTGLEVISYRDEPKLFVMVARRR